MRLFLAPSNLNIKNIFGGAEFYRSGVCINQRLGLHPLQDCCLYLSIHFLIRKLVFLLMATSKNYELSFFCPSMLLSCPSCFLLWPSCFLNIPHISRNFIFFPPCFSLKSKILALLGNCNIYVFEKHIILEGGGLSISFTLNWLQAV